MSQKARHSTSLRQTLAAASSDAHCAQTETRGTPSYDANGQALLTSGWGMSRH